MQLARVRGTVVASVKDSGLTGYKMLLLEAVAADDPEQQAPTAAEGHPTSIYTAVDLVGAGVDEVVLVTFGSAARVGSNCQAIPTDAAVVAIVDTVQFDGKTTFFKR